MAENSRIILALDVTDHDKAVHLVNLMKDHIFAVKVGWPLLMESGMDLINELSAYTKVICDLKLADVPHTMSMITRGVSDHGAYGIISHSFIGADSLKEVVKNAKDTKVFSVVSMSNEGSKDFLDYVMHRLIQMSLEIGVHGFVAPGNKYDILSHVRRLAGDSAIIISPGVGVQGGDARKAIESGADYIIVGREIYDSTDPLSTVKALNLSLS